MNSPLIPRLEDLPYYTSPPIEFTYKSSAPFLAGKYTWADDPFDPATPCILTPSRPLLPNTLYYFRSITMAADIEELSYTANVDTTPVFQTYLKSAGKGPLFREPIVMVKYLQNFDYRLLWMTHHSTDQLYASFNGTMVQDATLVGVSPINLIAVISAQEISDEAFVKRFMQNYGVNGGLV